MAFESGAHADYLTQLDLHRGLCIPFTSELRRSEDFFDLETYEVYLHEYKHVAATIGLFDDFYEGSEYILMVTGVANERYGYQGLTLVSNILGEEKIGTIAAAGLIPEDDGSIDPYSRGDRLQVQEISVNQAKTADLQPFVDKAQEAIRNSALSSRRLREKLAEMSVYLQNRLDFSLITREMLQAMYEQAVNEIECEDSGTDISNLIMFDQKTLGEYRKTAQALTTRFVKPESGNLNGSAITTDFTRAPVENTQACPSCGELLSPGILHSCV